MIYLINPVRVELLLYSDFNLVSPVELQLRFSNDNVIKYSII
jgi:hypothetical protein